MVKPSICLIILLSFASAAQADDASQAKEAYAAASRFFQAEEFEAALPLFERAYQLSGRRPATIFGLAQCERSLKRYDQAVAHFQEYLATQPENAQEVEETIALLQDLILARDEAEARRQAEAVIPVTPQPEPEPEPEPVTEPEPIPEPVVAPEPPAVFEAVLGPPPPPTPVLVATPVAAEDDGGVLTSPWFWVVTGVVVVGGAVASGIFLSSRAPADIYGGTTGVVISP